MAIFGSKKETDTKQNPIRPVVKRTENVAKELLNIAISNRVEVASLDFNLLEIETLTRKKASSREDQFKEINDQELEALKKSKLLMDQSFEIKQIYEIEVFTKKPRPQYDKFHFSIGVNATMCKVFLTIKDGSFLEYSESFEEDFLELINKKKIRANILVGIFDDMVPEVVSKLNASLMVNETMTFEKTDAILVAEGIEPIPTFDDQIIMHFREKNSKNDIDKIDYSKRNYILSVVKDELLIEYIKPKKGSSGRNCRGEFIVAREPVADKVPTFKVSDNIATIETKESIEYRAKKNGYIVYENETYDIRDEMDINEISFKTTGSIETRLDADVSLKVKEADVFKDAVGMGMEVEVSELDVEGNIGPKAKVLAKRAKIDGQTHKTSFVKADDLTINVHKGTAEGDAVHITRLEQGVVKANTIDVAQAIGGNIKAKEITIDLIGSNVTMTASKTIEIHKMQGSENRFIIDPLAVDSIDRDVDEKENELDNVEIQTRAIKKDIEKYTELIQKNEKSFLEIKRRLLHYKKNDIKMPEAFVKQYKQFQKVQAHLEELKNSLNEQGIRKDKLNTSIKSVQENIFAARIINKDRWIGYNEIRFKLIDPPIDVVYTPIEGSYDTVYALFQTDDNEYVIKAIKG
ncbi:flagellar assembly protein A [Sulfurimonas sp. HSL-1716]|uniref:flagellar assembly protein A n=1 Tax=Hydrocurvibacter sulfurireducens TaxID=3131937 RepID=UPI0031F99813